MAGIRKLLFVDTNILLDFYRARTEAGLSLLEHLETVADSIIVTYQLEMEFRKNRQFAMIEGLEGLKPTGQLARPGLFSDAKATRAMVSNQKKADAQARKLKERMIRAVKNPTTSDPVYKVCQRIFHKGDSLVLSEANAKECVANRRAALRRFLQGYPPRKKNETSMGDAINWEWMISCAIDHRAELVIVTRDADYGSAFDGQVFLNDHLRQEFSDRVSRKRQVRLLTKLSEALKLLKVHVTPAEVAEEEEIAQPVPKTPLTLLDILASPEFKWPSESVKWSDLGKGVLTYSSGPGYLKGLGNAMGLTAGAKGFAEAMGLTAGEKIADAMGLTAGEKIAEAMGLTTGEKIADAMGLARDRKGDGQQEKHPPPEPVEDKE